MSEDAKTTAGKAAALKRLNARRIRTIAVAVASVLGVPVVLLQLLNLSCSTLGMFCVNKPATEVAEPATRTTQTASVSASGQDVSPPPVVAEAAEPRPLHPATATEETKTAALEATSPPAQTLPERAWLGIRAEAVSASLARELFMPSPQGAHVISLAADGPAAKAGIAEGDVISSINGSTVRNADDLQQKLISMSPREGASLEIIRKGLHSFINIDFSNAVIANDASLF